MYVLREMRYTYGSRPYRDDRNFACLPLYLYILYYMEDMPSQTIEKMKKKSLNTLETPDRIAPNKRNKM